MFDRSKTNSFDEDATKSPEKKRKSGFDTPKKDGHELQFNGNNTSYWL